MHIGKGRKMGLIVGGASLAKIFATEKLKMKFIELVE